MFQIFIVEQSFIKLAIVFISFCEYVVDKYPHDLLFQINATISDIFLNDVLLYIQLFVICIQYFCKEVS